MNCEGNLMPYVKGQLLRYGDDYRKYTCFYISNKEYEVGGMGKTWMVDISKFTCDYRE